MHEHERDNPNNDFWIVAGHRVVPVGIHASEEQLATLNNHRGWMDGGME